MSEPQVSVILAAFNGERYLRDALGSVFAQEYSEKEVIVIDDGSTDDTAARAEALGAEVIRLGHRAGPAEARNRGVEAVEAGHEGMAEYAGGCDDYVGHVGSPRAGSEVPAVAVVLGLDDLLAVGGEPFHVEAAGHVLQV